MQNKFCATIHFFKIPRQKLEYIITDPDYRKGEILTNCEMLCTKFYIHAYVLKLKFSLNTVSS